MRTMATTENGERLGRRICWMLAAVGLALLAVTVAQAAGSVPQSAMGATVSGAVATANSGAVLATGDFGAARPDAMTVGMLLTGVVMWVTERRLWAR